MLHYESSTFSKWRQKFVELAARHGNDEKLFARGAAAAASFAHGTARPSAPPLSTHGRAARASSAGAPPPLCRRHSRRLFALTTAAAAPPPLCTCQPTAIACRCASSLDLNSCRVPLRSKLVWRAAAAVAVPFVFYKQSITAALGLLQAEGDAQLQHAERVARILWREHKLAPPTLPPPVVGSPQVLGGTAGVTVLWPWPTLSPPASRPAAVPVEITNGAADANADEEDEEDEAEREEETGEEAERGGEAYRPFLQQFPSLEAPARR